MFNEYKFSGYFRLVFSSTILSNHNYNLNNNCLKRKLKDRKIVISLNTEFIENKKMIAIQIKGKLKGLASNKL